MQQKNKLYSEIGIDLCFNTTTALIQHKSDIQNTTEEFMITK